MKSYGTDVPRVSPLRTEWARIVAQIEAEGFLDEWVSPVELQALPNLMSMYAIVKRQENPELRALAGKGYIVTPKTTNNQTVNGRRVGDLLLRVTKKEN